MKYVVFVLILFLVFLILCLTGCSLPLPIPSAIISADDLREASFFKFKGKFYVLGGYYTKDVPAKFTIFAEPVIYAPFGYANRESTGMKYKTRKILNEKIYEITDYDEAFII